MVMDFILKGVWKYLQAHPDKVEELITAAIKSLVIVLLQKLAAHQADNGAPAPAPAPGVVRA